MTFKLDGWPWKTKGHLLNEILSFVHHFNAIDKFKLTLQSGNAQFGAKWTIYFSCVTLQFYGWPRKTIGHLFYVISSFVHHFVPIGEFKLELQSRNAQFGSNSTIFLAVWHSNLTDDLEKNNRAPILCYFKHCASFRTHWWIQTGVAVRKRPIWIKFDDFFSRVTFKLDRWPWKTIRHLFYATSSIVHLFVPIGGLKLELQSEYPQFRTKSTIFFSRMTSKIDRWPWKTTGYKCYATSNFVHYFVPIGEFKLGLQSGKSQFGSNSTIILAVWPWNVTDDLEKQ